jgi:uncharacterized protein DUF6580
MEITMTEEKYIPFIIALGLIVMGISLRILPHQANFAPVTAIAIFSGVVLPRRVAWWVPLVIMIVSDAIIGFYSLMPIVWGCYVLIALASSVWLRKPNLRKGVVLTIASSVFFFVVTNFAVWLAGGMYTHTWSGFIQCYAMALPFFRNTALSDSFYTALLFSVFALVIRSQSKLVSDKTRQERKYFYGRSS